MHAQANLGFQLQAWSFQPQPTDWQLLASAWDPSGTPYPDWRWSPMFIAEHIFHKLTTKPLVTPQKPSQDPDAAEAADLQRFTSTDDGWPPKWFEQEHIQVNAGSGGSDSSISTAVGYQKALGVGHERPGRRTLSAVLPTLHLHPFPGKFKLLSIQLCHEFHSSYTRKEGHTQPREACKTTAKKLYDPFGICEEGKAQVAKFTNPGA